ncbi:hypothetical protein BDZ91DRAFT_746550, partial [Kalaharituber pfeilii]
MKRKNLHPTSPLARTSHPSPASAFIRGGLADRRRSCASIYPLMTPPNFSSSTGDHTATPRSKKEEMSTLTHKHEKRFKKKKKKK